MFLCCGGHNFYILTIVLSQVDRTVNWSRTLVSRFVLPVTVDEMAHKYMNENGKTSFAVKECLPASVTLETGDGGSGEED
jgi:hypothetical protein